MKLILWISVLIFSVFSCSKRGNIVEVGGYSFNYEGKEYRIQSVTPTISEGYNILMRRDDGKLILKAIDKEQDGILDEVTAGNLSLQEAGRIYQEGIAEGERRGYIKKRTFAREYRYNDDLRNYILATYVLAFGDIYNKLTVVDRTFFRADIIVIDKNADGKLDEVVEGTETLGAYQKYYETVISMGMRVNRIKKMNGTILVVQ
ncbi:hypothetical protein JW835_00360 [bacterium]|nr:hypothetical protein [bacterium]